MTRTVAARIARFNRGREPERLAIKYATMAKDPHRFLRGTAHLFYEDWPARTPLNRAPATWVCGDLHMENFGTYKGDDRLLYFDINDFDESLLAPCTWDLARICTSVLLVAGDNGLSAGAGARLCRAFLASYREALGTGKAGQVERLLVGGMVGQLLDKVAKRSRADLLAERTTLRKGRRRITLGEKALPCTAAQRAAVTALLRRVARGEENRKFFKVLDVARRVAGVGSLGTQRYMVLVEGNGSPGRNFLLEVKEAPRSALARYVPNRQPRWRDDGERIASIQFRMQAVTPALLHPVVMNGTPFIIKELQPSQDKLSLDRWKPRLDKLETAMITMGHVVAWDQLRSAGRQGSATADELMIFADAKAWQGEVLRYARRYAKQVRMDWKEFRSAAIAVPNHR
jgi:uncharacterized protein (DUF2252 family)